MRAERTYIVTAHGFDPVTVMARSESEAVERVSRLLAISMTTIVKRGMIREVKPPRAKEPREKEVCNYEIQRFTLG